MISAFLTFCFNVCKVRSGEIFQWVKIETALPFTFVVDLRCGRLMFLTVVQACSKRSTDTMTTLTTA